MPLVVFLATDAASKQNNTAATSLCCGESKTNVVHSEFICIINPFKISSAFATYAAKRLKKTAATSLYWGENERL